MEYRYKYEPFDCVGAQKPFKWIMRNLDKGIVELFPEERVVRVKGVVSQVFCRCSQKEWEELLQHLEEK